VRAMKPYRVTVVVGMAIATALALLAGCGGDDEETTATAAQETTATATTATETTTAGGASGMQLFVSTCGGCHTLGPAGTNGTIGPNLDEHSPDEEEVLEFIENGGGEMPANLLQGAEAEAVAEYVAENAGGGG
jgi:cytochrome c551